ncbi:MAG: UDP-N-acetylmuramoyl-L-alanine--D-glutamate ligase [Spirochaetaceae bacterium]|nr:MAG: UDP-N-acetylmuramoyl-L-alanine--D-glutamate ligase [Spirochaetaceae bacterium]
MSSPREDSDLDGRQVVVLGLGAHGGGVATARYCVEHGARVCVTDLRSEADLDASLRALAGLDIRYVLGRHDIDDISNADIVVKNPAVRRTAPVLSHARRIETDISLFLKRHRGPVIAVTGTKGKSTTASAIHHVLRGTWPGARLGGNITVSPLSFADEISPEDPVVLELSSFQLGDLRMTPRPVNGYPFSVSVITNLLPDHQDYYDSMDAYAADKALIFADQRPTDWVVIAGDDEYCSGFTPPVAERTIRLPHPSYDPPTLVGLCTERAAHARRNLYTAGVAAVLLGVPAESIAARLAGFPGVPHRLERVAVHNRVSFVNDSAATIQEATLAALDSCDGPVHLIAGGSDKGLPVNRFVDIATRVASLHLLEGSATERIVGVLGGGSPRMTGPHPSLRAAVHAATAVARPGDTVLLSPGCASFGMFRNEFDRGDQFRAIVYDL